MSQISSHYRYREDPRRFGRRFDHGIDLRILMDSQATELGGLYGKQCSAPTIMSGATDEEDTRRDGSPSGASPAPRDTSSSQRKAGRKGETGEMEGANPLPPGENNPDSYLGANLCFDYSNKGL